MYSLSRLGNARRGLRAAVTATLMATALLIPALASADAVHLGYVWKKDADGNWEDRSNWNCIDPRTGNCSTEPAENKGYPNVAGDEVFFDAGNYTRRHTVVVTRTDIRVAKIVFGVGPGFKIQPRNLGQIILNSGLPSAPAEIVMNDRSFGDPSTMTELAVPFVNERPLIVTAVPGMQESSFGAVVEVTNEVPMVVERSMYWNANGVTFSGGTSAIATRLP